MSYLTLLQAGTTAGFPALGSSHNRPCRHTNSRDKFATHVGFDQRNYIQNSPQPYCTCRPDLAWFLLHLLSCHNIPPGSPHFPCSACTLSTPGLYVDKVTVRRLKNVRRQFVYAANIHLYIEERKDYVSYSKFDLNSHPR